MAGQVHLGISGRQHDTMSSMHCVYRSSELIYLAYLNSFIHGIEAPGSVVFTHLFSVSVKLSISLIDRIMHYFSLVAV